MAEWLTKLEELDIPDEAVAGLSNSDKPFIEGKLLQLSAEDRPLFFCGQQMDMLKRLRSLLPDTPAGSLTYSGRERGQSVIATLGAYAYNAWPLLLDLTDGEVHHLIMIRNDELTYWDSLSSQQAYTKQSELLLSSANLVDRKLTSIPEDLQQPLKKLRTLQVDSGLLEQLNGIVPDLPCDERLAASYELISTWAYLQPITLPAPLQQFIGDDSASRTL